MNETSILIVEDDQTVREVLTDYLSQLGYQVLTAADGLDGMEKIRSQHYNILLLDIRIPYISGLGLLKIARELYPDIPVICMTGYGASPERIAAEEQVEYILSKPFDLKELAMAITKLVPERG